MDHLHVVEMGQLFSRSLRVFNESELHFPGGTGLLSINFVLLSNFVKNGSDFDHLARAEAIKVAKVLLGAAVKCDNKQEFIAQITSLSAQMQQHIMKIIQSELLKEPVKSRETAIIAELEAQLEAERDEFASVRNRNTELVATCTALEEEMTALKDASILATASGTEGSADGGGLTPRRNEQSAEEQGLRERLRMVQDELYAREEEMVQLTAAAAEAQAKVRENRTLRDELDLLHEQLAEATHQLQVASKDSGSSKEVLLLREKLKQSQSDMTESINTTNAIRKLKSDLAAAKVEIGRLQGQVLEKNEWLETKAQDLEKSTANYIASKAQIGELSVRLENAETQLKQQKQLAASAVLEGASSKGAGASLMDEMMMSEQPESDGAAEALLLDVDRLNSLVCQLEEKLMEAQGKNSQSSAQEGSDAQKLRETIAELEEQLRARSEQSEKDVHALQKQLDEAQQEVANAAKATQLTVSPAAVDETAIRKLTAERDQLKHYLKLAKEKLVAGNSHGSSSGGIPANVDVELKILAKNVHEKGMEVLRLRHELDMMKQSQNMSTNRKHNGLLNHLRHRIDDYENT